MNKEELEQIKRELDEISKWPWGYCYDGSSDWSVGYKDDPQFFKVCNIYEYKKALPIYRSNAFFIAKAPERIDYLVNKLGKAMKIISFYNEAMDSVNCEEDIDGSLSCYAIYAEARNQADEFLEELEDEQTKAN